MTPLTPSVTVFACAPKTFLMWKMICHILLSQKNRNNFILSLVLSAGNVDARTPAGFKVKCFPLYCWRKNVINFVLPFFLSRASDISFSASRRLRCKFLLCGRRSKKAHSMSNSQTSEEMSYNLPFRSGLKTFWNCSKLQFNFHV